MTILRILAALLVLNVLVMIHELGHFIMAKLVGVKVNEFAIGMGPKLLSWGKGETKYSLRALPIGGFCAMEGEDEGAPTPSALGGNADRATGDGEGDSGSFANKKVWQRMLIVVAGAAMNLLLGFVLLLVYNGALQEKQPGSDQVLFATTTIAEIPEENPAYGTGLRPGDTIVEVNGRRIVMCDDLTMEMQNDADGKFDMVVRRNVDGESQKVKLDDVEFEVEESNGRQSIKYNFVLIGEPRTFWNTITYSAKQEVSIATIVGRTLIDLIQGDYGINDLSGPVGTVDVIADVVETTATTANWRIGVGYLVMLMTLLTVNLGVFNLLPLPALDGGRLVFLIWEAITRKPVLQKYEALIHFVGILLLLLLMVFVTYSDITKLFA